MLQALGEGYVPPLRLAGLRGELPELRQEHRVLTVGLFDGIAALRVACDLLGIYWATSA